MCDQIISVTFMNLVAPKAGAKDELLFNELALEFRVLSMARLGFTLS